MMLKLQNPAFANERVGVNQSTYTADSFGIVIADPKDAEILISVAGWKKLAVVETDDRVRLPETPDEFLAACRRSNVTAQDLRKMAQFLEAHETVDFLPQEPEDVEPEYAAIEEVELSEDDDLPQENEMDASLDPLDPIGDTDDEFPPDHGSEDVNGGNGNGNGSSKTKSELLEMAKGMGIPADGRWGRKKILDAIEATGSMS